MMRIQQSILLAAVLAVAGCGTSDPSYRLGYSVQVASATVSDVGGEDDAFGAIAEVDVIQNMCTVDTAEEWGATEAALVLRLARRGGSFNDDGVIDDEVSELETGLEVRVTRVTIEYTQVPSGGNDVSVNIAPIDINYGDSGLVLDGTEADVEKTLVLPIITIGTKIKLQAQFLDALEDWDPSDSDSLIPVAQLSVRYTVYYRDNFGEEGFVTHTGQIHLAPWNRC